MELGPTATPGPSDWTDLSDRVMACSDDRGRDNEVDEFRTGSATLTLDNSDRLLDPSVVGALNELAADKGLPGCPARLLIDWDGSQWEWMVGVLGDEPWTPDDAAHGSTGTVSVEVVDTTARDGTLDLPDDVVRAAMLSANPSWWGRQVSLLGVRDWSPADDPGTFLFGATPAYSEVAPLVPDTGLPGMVLHEIGIELPAALAGPTTDFSVFLVTQAGSFLNGQVLARKPSTVSNPGWRIVGDAVGNLVQAEFFAPGGAFVAATSPIGVGAGPICLTVEGGVKAVLSNSGTSTTLTSASIPTGFTGQPRFGDPANTLNPRFAEMAYWDGVILSPAQAAGLIAVCQGAGWSLVPTLDLRIAAWQALAGSTSPVQIHPVSLPQLAVVEGVPSTLADGYREGAEAGRGATYSLRDGTVRVRTVEALTDPTLSTYYADAIAHLTDEPSPAGSPPPVRRSPVKWSGVRSADVVNVSIVEFRAWGSDAVLSAEDLSSIARFGRRVRTFRSNFADSEATAMQAIADADVARYAWPRRRMDALTVEPLLDGVADPDDAVRFVVEDLELERAVDVTWTPVGGSPVTVTQQVQGWSSEWTPDRWTVTLSLAES